MPKTKTTKKLTQAQAVLAYLQHGARTSKKTQKTTYIRTITPIEALTLFGSFRLSAIIFELKAKGHMFEDTVYVKNEHGNSFAQYKLK